MMEYLGYFVGGFVSFVFAVVIAVLQTNNNRKYNEFKKLEEKVNEQDKKIAVNTNSDEKDSKRFDEHQRSMESKFGELNKMLTNFTSKVESEIKDIKNSVNKLAVIVAGINKNQNEKN